MRCATAGEHNDELASTMANATQAGTERMDDSPVARLVASDYSATARALEMRLAPTHLGHRKGVRFMASTAAPSVELGPLGLENPMGTDGFEFVEYTAPDIELLRSLFTKMGFPEVARHKSKDVTLHKQGDCNFIINAEPGSYADEYAKAHGPSACAMAFRVKDAKTAHERAVRLGATDVQVSRGNGELGIPAIEGIGGSRLFFVDRYGSDGSIYE